MKPTVVVIIVIRWWGPPTDDLGLDEFGAVDADCSNSKACRADVLRGLLGCRRTVIKHVQQLTEWNRKAIAGHRDGQHGSAKAELPQETTTGKKEPNGPTIVPCRSQTRPNRGPTNAPNEPNGDHGGT